MADNNEISLKQSKFRPIDFTHFDKKDTERYISKLDRLQITDPYNAPLVLFSQFENSKDNIPDLQYPDIYNYLINFPSQYTGETLKAYKGLEGYKIVQSGFVMPLYLWPLVAQNSVIVTARVNHSQKLNDAQLKPWVMIRSEGCVSGAHCNCMAGFGECCSHVAAVLFKLWLHNHQRDFKISVTSKECLWSKPSEKTLKRVEYLEGKDIVCNKTQRMVDLFIKLLLLTMIMRPTASFQIKRIAN